MSGDDDAKLIAHDRTLLSDARPTPVAPAPSPFAASVVPAPQAALFRGPEAAPTLPSADAVRPPGPGEVRVGQVLAGKYKLVRQLGQGGMGKVYLAEHLGLGVPVAVKTMHPEIAAAGDYVRRFRREAHAASLLNHPNAVRVLDFGDDAGTLYMVMEYLQGRSLTSWLAQQSNPPPLTEVVDILVQLLDAFEVAHQLGIVHRDLKPENVHLTEPAAGSSGKRVVKVLDFGLAHVEDKRDQGPTLTAKDVIAGTPEYMSPEQCRSLVVGPSADIYSIGCLLTDMLQLRPPFVGNSAIEVLAKQMFSPPPPLLRPKDAEPVPALLERLRLDLLAKAPEKRPRSPLEVKARLHEAMSREATLLRLPTRKGDEPLGDRAARAPAWDTVEPAPATSRTRPRTVGLIRLSTEPGGVSEECETGLRAHKLDVSVLTDVALLPSAAVPVLVIDAGHLHEGARRILADLGRLAPRCHALVCAAQLDTERMNELVGAGASDVLRYPVTPDALARKLERVLRRGR